MGEEHKQYEQAFREIELFDALVIDLLRAQRLTRVPFEAAEVYDPTLTIADRMSETLISLGSQITELLRSGVNPTPILRGVVQSIQDAYVDPATSREAMGTCSSKRKAAVSNISKIIAEAVHNKSLEADLKVII